LDKSHVPYEIISWSRDGQVENNCIQFVDPNRHHGTLGKYLSYLRFASFVKDRVKVAGYEKLIVFSPQLAIFIADFLKKNYLGRYIFDYRDLSIEQKFLFRRPFEKVLANSAANVISSPGFKKYLPKGFDYIVSHNFNVDIAKKAIEENSFPFCNEDIPILTIGALRKDMNIEVIDALGNVPGFSLSFVGKGGASECLEKYTMEKGFTNITFTGYYKKEEEAEIYKNHAFVNIIYPLIPSHITALSNRFYNSLIYKRPMIVTSDTIQGEYAKQYEVGLVIDSCDNLNEKIIEYKNIFDFKSYSNNCNRLFRVLLDDNMRCEDVIKRFAES
jgi:hypothetical protein